MKKLMMLFAFMAILLFGLAACGDGGTSATVEPEPEADITEGNAADRETGADIEEIEVTEEATTLTFWTFVDSHAEYFAIAQNLWNERNPDRMINLETEVIPFGAMHENLLMALQSGTGAPDLSDVEIGMSGVYLQSENVPFLPQNEVLAPFMDYLIYSRVSAYSAHGYYFGVCYHVGSVMMFYNIAVFEEAGLDWNDIVTWDDFVAMGQEIREATGAYMMGIEGAATFALEAMVSQQGTDFTIDGAPNLNSPEMIRGLTLLQDMIYEYGMARVMPGLQIDSEEMYAEISQNNFAAIMAPSWYMDRYLSHAMNQAGNIALAPIPIFEEGNNRSASAGGTMTVVTNQVAEENAQLALEFVAFAKASYEMAAFQWNLLGFDPVRTDVLLSDAIRVPSDALTLFGEETFDVLYDIADETTGIRVNAANAFTVRDHIIAQILPNVIVERIMDAETALIEAQELLESMID